MALYDQIGVEGTAAATTIATGALPLGAPPAGTLILIAVCQGGNGTGAATISGFAVPTGLSVLSLPTAAASHMTILGKIAGASEPNGYTATLNSSNFATIQYWAFSGRNTAGTLAAALTAVNSAVAGATAASPLSIAITGVTAAAGDDILWVSGLSNSQGNGYPGPSFTPPSGFSSALTDTSTTSFTVGMVGACEQNVSAGATGTLTGSMAYTGGGTNSWGGYVISIAASPPSLTINATGRNATTADPVSCTMSGVCSSGVIMAAVRTNGANPGVITISDSVNSGNYIPIGQYSVSGIGTVAILYIVVNHAGTPVVTATNPGSAGMAISCINVIGFSSTPTIDTAATQEYTGSGTTVSGTPATAFNNEVLFTMQHNGTFISGAPAGWTGAGGTDYGYYIVNASAASAPYSATLGASSSWILLSAGLYSGSGNLTGGPLPRLLYIMP